MAATRIERLRTSGFGGGDFDIEFIRDIVVLYGPNGAGKSTIPTAISFALTGKVPSAGGTSPKATIDAIGREDMSEVWAEVCFSDLDGDKVEVGHRIIRKGSRSATCQPTILGKEVKQIHFEKELAGMGIVAPEFLSLSWLIYDSRPNRGRAILDRFADPKKHGKVKRAVEEHKAKLQSLKEQLRGRRSAISSMTEEIRRIERGHNKGVTIQELEAEVNELRESILRRSTQGVPSKAEQKTGGGASSSEIEEKVTPPSPEPEQEAPQEELHRPKEGAAPDDGTLDLRTLIEVSKAMKVRGCACETSAWIMRQKMKAKGRR